MNELQKTRKITVTVMPPPKKKAPQNKSSTAQPQQADQKFANDIANLVSAAIMKRPSAEDAKPFIQALKGAIISPEFAQGDAPAVNFAPSSR